METLNQAQEHHAHAVGRVVLVFGEAGIEREGGAVATLQSGAAIYLGDTIVTGQAAALTVAMADGSQLDFGPRTRARMDPEVFDLDFVADTMPGNAAVRVEVAQAALVAGVDPSELEPAARGSAPANDEVRDFVIPERSVPFVEPDSGVETESLQARLLALSTSVDPLSPEVSSLLVSGITATSGEDPLRLEPLQTVDS